jgi:hypothetical protein
MYKFIFARTAVLVLVVSMAPSALMAASLSVPAAAVSFFAVSAARYSPSDSADTIYDESEKRAYKAFLRVGFAAPSMIYMMDKDLKRYYNISWGLMADCYFFRKRNRMGHGFDIGARFTYRDFKIGKDVLKKYSALVYEDNRLHMMSWDVSFRGVIGAYFFHELWQLYIVAAPRLLHYHAVMKDSRTGDPDKRINLVSIGIIGGAGIEVTILSMLGIFAEYNIGYTPVGTAFNNVEGHQVYVGLVWRTIGSGSLGY